MLSTSVSSERTEPLNILYITMSSDLATFGVLCELFSDDVQEYPPKKREKCDPRSGTSNVVSFLAPICWENLKSVHLKILLTSCGWTKKLTMNCSVKCDLTFRRKERLSATLRFLASGQSFEDLKFLTAISPQSLGLIVMETCNAINQALKNYIQVSRVSNNV